MMFKIFPQKFTLKDLNDPFSIVKCLKLLGKQRNHSTVPTLTETEVK